VVEAILIALAIVVAAFIINGAEDYSRHRDEMSFREAMDLAELPVVTFYQGTEKFNFLLDTGSNHSHISVEAADRIKGVPMVGSENVQGVGGTMAVDRAVNATIEYKSKSYEVLLLVGEHLSDAFRAIKETTGVQVHGILGSGFLSDNRYVLDFDELIAYSKV
jgi:hypothetical protein